MLHLSEKSVARSGLVAVATGAAIIALSSPAFAKIPRVKVSPHTDLKNKQVVTVAVAHFPANTLVKIIECNDNGDGDLANCNQGGSKQVTTNSHGKITGTTFTIRTGVIGNGTCGTSDSDKFCYVAALASTQMQATGISFR